jgi:hypothetical protein
MPKGAQKKKKKKKKNWECQFYILNMVTYTKSWTCSVCTNSNTEWDTVLFDKLKAQDIASILNIVQQEFKANTNDK